MSPSLGSPISSSIYLDRMWRHPSAGKTCRHRIVPQHFALFNCQGVIILLLFGTWKRMLLFTSCWMVWWCSSHVVWQLSWSFIKNTRKRIPIPSFCGRLEMWLRRRAQVVDNNVKCVTSTDLVLCASQTLGNVKGRINERRHRWVKSLSWNWLTSIVKRTLRRRGQKGLSVIGCGILTPPSAFLLRCMVGLSEFMANNRTGLTRGWGDPKISARAHLNSNLALQIDVIKFYFPRICAVQAAMW